MFKHYYIADHFQRTNKKKQNLYSFSCNFCASFAVAFIYRNGDRAGLGRAKNEMKFPILRSGVHLASGIGKLFTGFNNKPTKVRTAR